MIIYAPGICVKNVFHTGTWYICIINNGPNNLRGLFCTFDNYKNDIICDSYGFYSVGKHVFLDEYGKVMDEEPKLLGVFGVSTINGISIKLDTELIINKII